MGAFSFVDLSSPSLDLSTNPIFTDVIPTPADSGSLIPPISATGSDGGNVATSPIVLSDDGTSAADGSSSSGWLSGLGDLFQGVGAGVGAGLAGANLPKVSAPTGWVFNPTTGQYYNPATGQALTSTGTLPSAGGFNLGLGGNSGIFLIILAVAAILFFRK